VAGSPCSSSTAGYSRTARVARCGSGEPSVSSRAVLRLRLASALITLASMAKALAADQPFLHAPVDHTLEQMSKGVALTKPAVPILRERRVVRHRILETQPTEPAVGQIEVDLAHSQRSQRMPKL